MFSHSSGCYEDASALPPPFGPGVGAALVCNATKKPTVPDEFSWYRPRHFEGLDPRGFMQSTASAFMESGPSNGPGSAGIGLA
jgi:hypothetical protein